MPTHAKPDELPSIDWLRITSGMVAGKAESLEVFYEHFFDLMMQHARRASGGDEATCLDIVHDAFLKIVRCIKPMQDGRHVTAWTRTVVQSVAYDLLRKRRRQDQLIARAVPSTTDAQRNDVEQDARLAWIEQQLEQLEPSLRRMISWRYRLGWTLAKIASQCGLKPGAVDGRIRRAMEHLQHQAELEFDD